jgi:hypothetical protein
VVYGMPPYQHAFTVETIIGSETLMASLLLL